MKLRNMRDEHSRELVDGDDDLQPKLARVLDMPDQVLAPFLQRTQVLLGIRVVQRLAGRDVRSTAVHLQGTRRSNNDDSVGLETAHATLDVAELLHAHVRAETTLSEDVPHAVGLVSLFSTCKLERHAVCEDGRVSVGDVGEGTGVYEDWSTLRVTEKTMSGHRRKIIA